MSKFKHQDFNKRKIATEILEFIPIHFIDEIINSVNDLIYQAIHSLENFVQENNLEETEQVFIF